MVNDLAIGDFVVRLVPVREVKPKFDKDVLMTEDKRIVKEVTVSHLVKQKFYVDTKEECSEKTFKAINGEPVDKMSAKRDVSVDDLEIVDPMDMLNYSNSSTYLLVGDDFKKYLKELYEGKALKFDDSRGSGFKPVKSFVWYHKELNKVLMMCFSVNLLTADLSEVVMVGKDKKEKTSVKKYEGGI